MSKCYLVIDCGTTNLRVKLLDENKNLVDAVKAEGGVRHTSIDGHNGRLRTMLHESIVAVLEKNGIRMTYIVKTVINNRKIIEIFQFIGSIFGHYVKTHERN